ncbi:hypothetical protein SEUCBS139899_010764 [Sporothrix eucalyptigena]|uniref:CBM-cenC domain-containing protein n=1 Tax=Sporothrix eucalyptigena TaxID=1812306 RepID=A0ABP0BYV4_9PEZI
MVQLKSLTLALAALFAGVRAGPCAVTCNPANVLQDGDFEGDNSVWTFDSDVTIQQNAADSTFGAEGTNYVNVYIATREDSGTRYGITQQLSGLVPNKGYTLQFTWELTDDSGVYDGSVDMQVTIDGIQVDSIYFKRNTGIINQRTVYFTPTTSNPVLYVSCGGTGDYFYGATVIMDNFSVGQTCSQ